LSNLTTRVIVALVGIPLIVLLTMAGGFAFFLLVAAISTLGLVEFYRLARERGASPQTVTGLVFGLAVNLAFFHGPVQFALLGAANRAGIGLPFPSMPQLLMIVLLIFIPLTLVVELFRNRPGPMQNIAVTLLGVVYVAFFLGTLVGLRELFVWPDFPVYAHFEINGAGVPPAVAETIYGWGGLTVISLFAAIWICDSAAYFAGLSFGRHKLLERVSPKKTWEGAMAGGIAAILAFVAARALFLPYMSLTTAVVCGLIVGVFGQIGDLVESLLKRDAGVKDSSALIPGHGGVLDRFDSLMFAAPLVYLYLDFVVF
jgi:phosphatidate cytidylyltransferase